MSNFGTHTDKTGPGRQFKGFNCHLTGPFFLHKWKKKQENTDPDASEWRIVA